MTRIVCFGELLLRLSPPGHERLFQSPTLRTYFGGSEANTAASLAHFGAASSFVTRLPANAVGDAALTALRAEGVDVRHVTRGGPRMGIYFVEPGADLRALQVVYDRAGSSFSQLAPDDIPWDEVLRDADWFHSSGITPALGDGPAESLRRALDAAKRLGVPASMDLNYRPALWAGRDPRAIVRPLAERCTLVIGNPGAVEIMLGVPAAKGHDEQGLRETARRVHEALGCVRVALTRREVLSASEHGWAAALYDCDSDALHTSRRYQVRVVDRVGGGDSFGAALLHALTSGRTPGDALHFAAAASALKLTIPGDFNRVSADEVDRLLQASE